MDLDIPQCAARMNTEKTESEMPATVDSSLLDGGVIVLLKRSLSGEGLL